MPFFKYSNVQINWFFSFLELHVNYQLLIRIDFTRFDLIQMSDHEH